MTYHENPDGIDTVAEEQLDELRDENRRLFEKVQAYRNQLGIVTQNRDWLARALADMRVERDRLLAEVAMFRKLYHAD
jgi:uncharacterized coiled-coil DUF342 family protein